jgi:YggT family protein
VELICTLLGAYLIIIFIRIILSWFPIAPGSAMEGIASFFYALTEPVMAPVRALLPPVRLGAMGLDLSPIIVLFGIQIIRAFIC